MIIEGIKVSRANIRLMDGGIFWCDDRGQKIRQVRRSDLSDSTCTSMTAMANTKKELQRQKERGF